MFKFDALPQLAVGNHGEGSGYACIMNVISYLQGDKQISDYPSCVWKPLARMAQLVNDTICTHSDIPAGPVRPLCGPCSHQMWLLGVNLIGTAVAVDRVSEEVNGLMALQLFTAQTMIDKAIYYRDDFGALVAMSSMLMRYRLNPGHRQDIKARVTQALELDSYFSQRGFNITWGQPWRASYLGALKMIEFDVFSDVTLENLIIELMDSVPVESRVAAANEVIQEFNLLTRHIPILPTLRQVEDMRVKAGLVNV